MSRFLLLTLLNLSLPFLVRAAWLMWLHQRHRRFVKRQPEIIDVTPPQWHFPVMKLLAVGLALLGLTLLVLRLLDTQVDTSWHQSNPAVSREY